MTLFPLVNLIFLILIYRVHRPIFWISTFLEVALYVFGVMYIETMFRLQTNQFLYYLALTGAGLVLAVASFFIAISLNHRHLYDTLDSEKKPHE